MSWFTSKYFRKFLYFYSVLVKSYVCTILVFIRLRCSYMLLAAFVAFSSILFQYHTVSLSEALQLGFSVTILLVPLSSYTSCCIIVIQHEWLIYVIWWKNPHQWGIARMKWNFNLGTVDSQFSLSWLMDKILLTFWYVNDEEKKD